MRRAVGRVRPLNYNACKGDRPLNPHLIALPMLALSVILSAHLPASEVLEAARKASIACSEALQSAQGSGTFTVHRRNLTDKNDTVDRWKL